jgi:predicted nucleic-acid-binding Zn-ribbon protein
MTLTELAAQSGPMTDGRLTCPNCGCRDFKTYGTVPGVAVTFRYKRCRHCGKKQYTEQPPERIIRSIDDETDGESEGELL